MKSCPSFPGLSQVLKAPTTLPGSKAYTPGQVIFFSSQNSFPEAVEAWAWPLARRSGTLRWQWVGVPWLLVNFSFRSYALSPGILRWQCKGTCYQVLVSPTSAKSLTIHHLLSVNREIQRRSCLPSHTNVFYIKVGTYLFGCIDTQAMA